MSELQKSSVRKALLVGPAVMALLAGWFTWMGPERAEAQMGAIPLEESGIAQPVSLLGALEAGKLPAQKFQNADALRSFYQSRDHDPVWTARFGRHHVKAEQVLGVLENSWTHGLNPQKYHVTRIRALLHDMSEGGRAELELLVSDALVRYGRDLTGMRINPGDFAQKSRYWRQPVEAGVLLQDISASADPVRALSHYVPQGNFYAALRGELVRLVNAPDEEGAPLRLNRKLKPGDMNAAVPQIRARLQVPPASPETEKVYDDTLALAVMALQRQHNVKADGVIGPQTVALINKSRQEKIDQLVANLERLRWVEQDKPERYVLVNIPSATLWAVDDGKVELEMKVIVGKKARPTNSFKTEISGVRLNPNWTVPPTIKKQDFLPSLQEDPTTLSRKGIGLYRNGVNIDPATIDWNNISARELAALRMTQAPGSDNPLGKVRVIMENPYNIYLHDTNKRDYFEKDDRALSSGCIRVAEPEKLASFILSPNKEWSAEKMDKILASGRMTDVPTDTPIPVYILYQTVWQNEKGEIVYGEDVYGQDRRLIDQLGAAEAFHSPKKAPEAPISF